jgi:uncharacterized heparinase superfamily protein
MSFKTIFDSIKNQILKKYYFVIKQRFFSEKLIGAEFYRLFPYSAQIHGLSASSFLEEFQRISLQNFFFNPDNRKDFFLQLLSQADPMPQPLMRAEKILQNKHTIFGREYWYGQQMDWFLDFSSDQKFPSKPFYTHVKTQKYNADIKVPWELSRFGFVWILGKAYWLSGRKEFKDKFLALFNDWHKTNSFCYGINWLSPMEVGLRSMNLIAGMYFFMDDLKDAGETSTQWVELLKCLYQHGQYLESNIETGPDASVNVIASAAALFMLGICFKPSSFSVSWISQAKAVLESEIQRQTYADGMHTDMSLGCHRFSVEILLAVYLLAERTGTKFSVRFRERLQRMAAVVLQYSRPDGSSPVLGDSDDGRLFWFNPEDDYNDHTSLLCLAAIAFERREFKRPGQTFSEAALWLCGAEGWEQYQKQKPDTQPLFSKKLNESQLVAMRSDSMHCLVDCGEIGRRGKGGYGHNDILSFELWADGVSFLVDSGSLRYSGNKSLRNDYRSTKAHNTVMVDGVEQADFLDDFHIKADYSTPKILQWTPSEDKDVLIAEHYAYKTMLTDPVTHNRTLILEKDLHRLTLIDHLFGKGNHIAELFFHFNPNIHVEKTSYNRIYLMDTESGLKMDVDYERKDEEILLDQGTVAHRYGQARQAKVLRFRKRFSGEMTFKIMFTLTNHTNG